MRSDRCSWYLEYAPVLARKGVSGVDGIGKGCRERDRDNEHNYSTIWLMKNSSSHVIA